MATQTGASCYVDPSSPPSSYAVASVYEGDPGAWGRVVVATGLRTVFVLPGLAIAGVRGRQLLLGSFLGSVGITAALFALYGLKRAKVMQW